MGCTLCVPTKINGNKILFNDVSLSSKVFRNELNPLSEGWLYSWHLAHWALKKINVK